MSVSFRAPNFGTGQQAIRAAPARHTTVFCALLTLTATTLFAVATFDNVALPMDEGALLVYPRLVLDGEIPNKDFETFYGPGNVWLLAGTYSVFGESLLVERVVGVIYRQLIVLGVFAIASHWGRGEGVAAGLIAGMCLAALGPAAYAWLGGLALAICSVAISIGINGDSLRNGHWRYGAAGALVGLALVVRPDLIVAVCGAHAVLIWGRGRRPQVVTLIGFAIGVAPLLLHALLAGPENAFLGIVVEPLETQTTARRLPIPSLTSEVGVLFALVLAAPVLMFVCSAVLLFVRKGDLATPSLALAVFAAGLLPQMLQRAELLHTLYVGCVLLAFFPILVGSARRLAHSIVVDAAVAGSCALIVALILVATDRDFSLGVVPSQSVEVGGREFPMFHEEDTRELTLLLADVERVSEPDSRLFVGPKDLRRTNYNDTYLYFLLDQLTPATYFLEMNPRARQRRGDRLKNDIRSADVLILTGRYDGWNEPNDSSHFGSTDLNELVASEFCVVSVRSYWTLMTKC